VTESHPPVHQRALELLERAERVGGLGSWEWHPDSGELLWSENLYRLYGHEPGAVEPSTGVFLALVHPDDHERVAAALARRSVEGLAFRIVRPDGGIRHLQAAMAEGREGGWMVGSIQDVTERRRADREIAGHVAVAEALERWTGIDTSGPDLLARLGAAFDACCGRLWLPEEGELSVRAAWTAPGAELPPERADQALATAAWRRGTPGVTASRGAAQTSLTIPARTERDILAVAQLTVPEDIEAGERLLRTLTGIGSELGHFLQRRRGELSPGPLTPRELEVLQLAAHGASAREIAARLEISPATVKRHFESIYARLGVADRASAVATAMRRGFVE
jgi:DNA-binding CsgD family transcriptional regulator